MIKDGAWGSDTVYIIGSGPSRGDYDIDSLRDKKTIALNAEMGLCPWATAGAFLDEIAWKWAANFNGERFTRERTAYRLGFAAENINILPMIDHSLGDSFETGVCCNMLTGMFALNIALILTTGKIYLIGYDFCDVDGKVYHKEHPEHETQSAIYNSGAASGVINKFDFIFNSQKHRIFNTSKISRLNFQRAN